MNRRDLAGQRFGKLTVLEDSGQRYRRAVVWRCRCDCGCEALVPTGKLTGGVTVDCGCVPRERAPRHVAEDLTGRVFGELTALYRMENRGRHTQWMCRCSCGREYPATAMALKQGMVRSCGCRQYDWFGGRDLTGRRFGRLTALEPVRRHHAGTSALWRCRCDCGREIETTAEHLLNGTTSSCGCLNREKRQQLHTYLHLAENTCVEALERGMKNNRANTSGFRGVYHASNGSWRVTINFQKKLYYLGTFKDYGAAVQARLQAEASLHQGFVEAYQAYQDRAETDPAWAEKNPFFYEVQRTDGRFLVSTNVMTDGASHEIRDTARSRERLTVS